jgi:pilus assembly protein CpaB
MLLAISNKPIDTKSTYTVGADVSRFQRRTVPSKGGGGAPAPDPAQAMAAAIGSLAGMGKPAAPAEGARPAGPTVRVARGNNVTHVPVGAK